MITNVRSKELKGMSWVDEGNMEEKEGGQVQIRNGREAFGLAHITLSISKRILRKRLVADAIRHSRLTFEPVVEEFSQEPSEDVYITAINSQSEHVALRTCPDSSLIDLSHHDSCQSGYPKHGASPTNLASESTTHEGAW